ncbi:hypothetical protein D5b_00246 [Faustovirus]|nr:hypothetical protein D5b_00246 [Faustovirus]AMN84668.1 hypothetical protein D6_00265 [Faustovirus]AMP44198.1 hypothetical protein PRJ_Dakar_00242 [Faustovirus]QKE50352.1 hypothetical protein F-VV10_0232 [Faustovirus]
MQIFTKGLYKGTFDVRGEVLWCDLIGAIIKRIPCATLDDIYVVYNGRCVDTDSRQTLTQIGLKDCATIDIFGRMRGSCVKCKTTDKK